MKCYYVDFALLAVICLSSLFTCDAIDIDENLDQLFNEHEGIDQEDAKTRLVPY